MYRRKNALIVRKGTRIEMVICFEQNAGISRDKTMDDILIYFNNVFQTRKTDIQKRKIYVI